MGLSFSVPDTELTLTLHNRRPEIIDNIFKGTPFLNMLRLKGGVELVDGGISIVRGLMYQAQQNAIGSFSGYDTLNTTAQDNDTSAVYPWASLYAVISIAWDEAKRNSGKHQLVNLLNRKIDEAEMSLRDMLNTQLLAAQPASGSKDLISLTELIDVDPTADPARTDSIGAIGHANTWWRNKDATTATGTLTVSELAAMFNTVSDGHDFPSFILMDQATYEAYEATQLTYIRYMDTKMADGAFEALAFKNTPVIWDGACTTDSPAYFINTKYLKLCIHPEAQFVTTEFQDVDDQAAKIAKILFMGNMTCTNLRRQGILDDCAA